MSFRWLLNATLSVAICLSFGCALLGKSEPQARRYFTPEAIDAAVPAGAPTAAPAASAAGQKLRLRLGRITAWSHLRERIVTRTSARELSYSETKRWTERPELYLQRSLSHSLFEERGLTQVISGGAPTLEVELVAFEEVESPRRALFQALVMMHDERTGLLQETVTVEQPIESKDADPTPALVEALARALKIAVAQISDKAVARLAAMPAMQGREP